jgi:hypothetical protein
MVQRRHDLSDWRVVLADYAPGRQDIVRRMRRDAVGGSWRP